MKILVVDDEERIRRLLKMYLEREEYIIDEAEDGNEALSKAFANDYDVILLDLMMPGKDGIEVCRELREKKATPVIMLTAKGSSITCESIVKTLISNKLFANRNNDKRCNCFSALNY